MKWKLWDMFISLNFWIYCRMVDRSITAQYYYCRENMAGNNQELGYFTSGLQIGGPIGGSDPPICSSHCNILSPSRSRFVSTWKRWTDWLKSCNTSQQQKKTRKGIYKMEPVPQKLVFLPRNLQNGIFSRRSKPKKTKKQHSRRTSSTQPLIVLRFSPLVRSSQTCPYSSP